MEVGVAATSFRDIRRLSTVETTVVSLLKQPGQCEAEIGEDGYAEEWRVCALQKLMLSHNQANIAMGDPLALIRLL